jgi:CRP-like cAMP-binding protein
MRLCSGAISAPELARRMVHSGTSGPVDPELFQGLDESGLAKVLRAGAIRSIASGVSLLKQGDQPDHLFLVQRGRFKMTSLAPDGSQKTLRFMVPGDIIGCAAVFSRFAYPATATAVTDSVVIAWTASQISSSPCNSI